MSASRCGSSITTAVTLAIMLLVLYVATWPPVEIKSSALIISSSTSRGGSITTVTCSYGPPWTKVVFRPLHAMRACNRYHNPVQSYWNWWMDRLGEKVSGGVIP